MTGATYTKLKDGSWGLRVVRHSSEEAPGQGEVVAVSKKDGSKKDEAIGRVLWSGTDRDNSSNVCFLCTIEATRAPARSSGGDGVEYIRGNRALGCKGCATCRSLGRMCKSCRYDDE